MPGRSSRAGPASRTTDRQQHRTYVSFLFALPPTRVWGSLVRGVLGASGSGERGQDAGRRLSAPHGTRARSYWLLVFTEPNTGEHGARGAGWRYKYREAESPRCGKEGRDAGEAGEGLGHASACGAQQGRAAGNFLSARHPTCPSCIPAAGGVATALPPPASCAQGHISQAETGAPRSRGSAWAFSQASQPDRQISAQVP